MWRPGTHNAAFALCFIFLGFVCVASQRLAQQIAHAAKGDANVEEAAALVSSSEEKDLQLTKSQSFAATQKRQNDCNGLWRSPWLSFDFAREFLLILNHPLKGNTAMCIFIFLSHDC